MYAGRASPFLLAWGSGLRRSSAPVFVSGSVGSDFPFEAGDFQAAYFDAGGGVVQKGETVFRVAVFLFLEFPADEAEGFAFVALDEGN